MTPPVQAILPDGKRRHFQHGPIDLVIEAFGESAEAARSYDQAWRRFQTILPDLVAELPRLRQPRGIALHGPVAQRMEIACAAHHGVFVTPMAAVAGAVADAVLAALVRDRDIARAYVNNGGDIALHLAPGQSFRTGLISLGDAQLEAVHTRITGASPVRGIATSGWRGRSQSLGIADSVTVLARTAAAADVAATLIANAVTVDDAAVQSRPAREIDADSDLGDRPVTVAVGALSPEAISLALNRGCALAESMADDGHIEAAHLTLKSERRIVGVSKRLENAA